MDFASDDLFDGRPFCILTVTDSDMRETLSPTPGANFLAFQAAEVPDALIRFLGGPESIRADNELEFTGRVLTNRPT